ncbi:MAG TPA: low temperature requirement protein A [Burkholderiales bacterium]|nr:low temperature requirement protein A [Burkholderiales bacterium]
MNAAIEHAFDEQPFSFVLPLLAIQIGRTALSTIPAAPTLALRRHYLIMLVWILASAPLWVAGAFAGPRCVLPGGVRPALVDTVGAWFAHPFPGEGFGPKISLSTLSA